MSLDIYTKIKTIKEDKNKSIYLVQNELDRLYYIEKICNKNKTELYNKLKNVHSSLIPEIYEIMEQKDKLIIIEQYMNSTTLDAYMLNHQLSNYEIDKIIKELCDAVSILHQNNIIHRDIKPENIFYNGKHIILFDYDIARIYNSEHNKDTMILGSVGYAAPEQFGFQQTDHRTDIYAIGVLMNVLYTSKFPNEYLYEGKCQKIIRKATQIDPKDRYSSAKEMKKALSASQWTLPGFRENKLSHKIIAVLSYLMIIWGVFTSEAEGIKKGSPLDIWLDITMLLCFFIIIAFITNYKNIHQYCLFQKSKNKYIRWIGIILSCLLLCLIDNIIYGIVAEFL